MNITQTIKVQVDIRNAIASLAKAEESLSSLLTISDKRNINAAVACLERYSYALEHDINREVR